MFAISVENQIREIEPDWESMTRRFESTGRQRAYLLYNKRKISVVPIVTQYLWLLWLCRKYEPARGDDNYLWKKVLHQIIPVFPDPSYT